MPRLLVYSSVWSDRLQPRYLNTLYLYFPLNTLIYLNKRLFSLFLKISPSIKLPGGDISIPHKLGFSEITQPQSLLTSNVQILNSMFINLFIIVFYSVCNPLCVANKWIVNQFAKFYLSEIKITQDTILAVETVPWDATSTPCGCFWRW